MASTFVKVKYGCCGIKHTNAKGLTIHETKTPADGAFELEIEQAKRLVKLGVAEFVEGTGAKTEPGDTKGAHFDAEQLESMDFNDLKKLAKDMGVTPEGKKKADYIEALLAAEIEPGEETDDDGDDEPPAPGAVDPE